MLYFSKSMGDKDKFDGEQYKKLIEFKNSFENRSVYQEYKDKDDFKEKFSAHLQIKLNEDEYFVQETIIDDIVFTEQEQPAITDLSKEAKILLLEAVKDPNGYILSLTHSRGASIRTNGKEFIEKDEPREIAKWEGAIEELENEELIRAQGYKRQSFKVTSQGYNIADLLNSNNN